MEKKKNNKLIYIVPLVIVFVTLGLSFYNQAFIPSFLLMLSLFLFSICFYIREMEDKKKVMYGLFIIGVLLIIGSLVYTYIRLS